MKDRIRLDPINEIIYPDSGGYTGFSIFIWNIGEKKLSEISLLNQWGGFYPDRLMPENIVNHASYLLEGRFFVFGSLRFLILETENNGKIFDLSDKLFEKWKVIMDEVTIKISNLNIEENDAKGTSPLDAIFSTDIQDKINNSYYKDRRLG